MVYWLICMELVSRRRYWASLPVHGHQRVVLTINVKVKTEVVDMLVRGADDVMVDQRPVTGILFGARIVHGSP